MGQSGGGGGGMRGGGVAHAPTFNTSNAPEIGMWRRADSNIDL